MSERYPGTSGERWKADALARGRGYKEINKDISNISLFPCWKILGDIFGIYLYNILGDLICDILGYLI